MYLGGLQVLHDPANRDRVAQSAHSMRELEDFLTSVLLPTTFDDLDAIDALLKESGDA